MVTKARRRQRIRELLAHNQVLSQEQLQDMLDDAGLRATQATLSRDLRDLGVLKGPAGYRLPEAPLAGSANGAAHLERVLPTQLLEAKAGGNLIVLRTGPGLANPIALEIDKAAIPGVMGTIAGDDTVFVATATTRQAERVLAQIRRLAGWSGETIRG